MATGGILGNGTKVGYASTSPQSWIKFASVMDVEFPGLNPDEVNTTVHGTSKFKRSMPGMIAVDGMTMKLLQDLDEITSSDQDALFDLSATQQTVWWRVEVPVDRQQSRFTAFEFQGWVKPWKPSTPIDAAQVLSVGVVFDGDSYTKYAAGVSLLG